MASASSGPDWFPYTISLLTSTQCTPTKSDLQLLVKAVIQSENVLASDDEEYQEFCISFAGLSAHIISSNAASFSRSQIASTAQACRILLRFFLRLLKTFSNACPLQDLIMALIGNLCMANAGTPSKVDLGALTNVLKPAKVPPGLLPKLEAAEHKEDGKGMSHLRLDPSAVILEQLMTSLLEAPPQLKQDAGAESMDLGANLSSSHIIDPGMEAKNFLLAKNLSSLQQEHGGDVLLDMCLALPSLVQFTDNMEDVLASGGGIVPDCLASSLVLSGSNKTLLGDISLVCKALSLPVLEPLNESRVRRLVTLALGCVHMSVAVAAAASFLGVSGQPPNKGGVLIPYREDEGDVSTVRIVEACLDIYNSIAATLRSSSRAGGHVVQNLHLLSSWLLLRGLQGVLNATSFMERPCREGGMPRSRTTPDHTPTRARDQSANIKQSFAKIQQGFGVLPVALANHVLSLLTILFGELRVEPGLVQAEKDESGTAAAEQCVEFLRNVTSSYPASKRISTLVGLNLTTLLFDLISVLYRKAGMLKRIQKHPADGDNFSTSDSNTYYEEDFSTSDDSSADEDDDSEPILGHWFEETLAPREQAPAPSGTQQQGADVNEGGADGKGSFRCLLPEGKAVMIPEKGEPHGYIALATKVLSFINAYLVNFESAQPYFKSSISMPQMVILAGVIKDLDRETCRSEAGTISILFGATLGQLYEDFSKALARFVHNILATGLLNETYQDGLLTHLNVNPWIQKEWPLQIYRRTLSILAQVLLLRQQKERDEIRGEHEGPCVLIFRLLLGTMEKAILSVHADDVEDLNVEHAQLLLFLFYSLPLMQKKAVLLNIAKTIVAVAPSAQEPLKDIHIVYIARMLHMFEYIIKNLYEAPAALVEQVQVNLFTVHGAASSNNLDNENSKQHGKLFVPCKEVEENFTKNFMSDMSQGAQMKPRFYYLMTVESGTQDVPKLDGFACSFMLATPDTLSYSELYSAVLSLLWIGAQCDAVGRTVEGGKLSYLGTSAVQFCFGAVWRLLLTLPPSVLSIEELATGNAMLDLPHILHAILWVSRIGDQSFFVWIRDCLVKQGLITHKAESLLHQVSKNAGQLLFDVRMFKQLVSKQLAQGPDDLSGVVAKDRLPRMMDLFVLEALIAKVQVSLDECLLKPSNENPSREVKDLSREIFPILLQLVRLYSTLIHWSILHQASELCSTPWSPTTLKALDTVLRMTSRRSAQVTVTATTVVSLLPPQLESILDAWTAITVNVCSWRTDFANDNLPSESFIASVQSSHFAPLSSNTTFSINPSLKRILQCIVRFARDVFLWSSEEKFATDLVSTMLPLLLDATTESLADFVTLALEGSIGSPDTDEFSQHIYEEMLKHAYDLLIGYSKQESGIDENMLLECLKFMEGLLDKQPGKKALEKFFAERDIWDLLLSAVHGNLSPAYGTRVLKFFSKLFMQIEKNPGDAILEKLNVSLSKMSKLKELDTEALEGWLTKVVVGKGQQNDEAGNIQENRLLLQNLTSYIVKDNSELSTEVAQAFMKALIALGSRIPWESDGLDFWDMMGVMATLAAAGSGKGHLQLFVAATEWLEKSIGCIAIKDVLEKLEENAVEGKHQALMESTCHLLSYIADVVGALKLLADRSTSQGRSGAVSPPCDGDLQHPEADSDWADEMGPDDEESGGEDSDEDSLCNKLCTFTMTQKEFMNQHWYHCHTCRMVDGVGVCTICAKVCHKDHDVTYAKFGSFFCDCGAKDDGTCQALVKRNPQSSSEGVAAASNAAFSLPTENVLPSSLRRRASSPVQGTGAAFPDARATQSATIVPMDFKRVSEENLKNRQQLSKKLEAFSENLISLTTSSNLANSVLSMVQSLMPAIIQTCNRNSPIGSSARAQKALSDLHSLDKTFDHVDQLMVPTLGSQEGAFENVRMNYSGEQGQTIRQLLSAHMIRRVAMCCLASTHGKRQHLAVSHEKGKITLLQLSALLKQADSSKRKLTITRLASAPVPFTVLSIAGNPCNEDYLAVCGLRDCHILTFSSSGSVSEHLVLHPQLETGNYIIKAIWLPGSQTELAVVTADFVKIYDLSVDALSAQFYFLLPTGRVRDCCFVFSEDGQRHLLLMSSAGHVYFQPLEEESSAKHGPFYVTSILDVRHPDIKDSVGTVAGGGVSIYYSHVLQLLFFSYANGKSFMASLPQMTSELHDPVLIQVKAATAAANTTPASSTTAAAAATSNGNSNATNAGASTSATSSAGGSGGSSKPTPQPLCQWSEVPNHPGLVLALMQFSNNPLVLMVKPGSVMIQEIKLLTAKSKITDLVAIRHPTSSGEMRTTMILLCEDGSLRIYMASPDQTGYWLRPAFQPTVPGSASGAPSQARPPRKKKAARVRGSVTTATSVSFPVDFFEHCSLQQDVEFGGNDLLQIYNTQQVKHRLNTNGMYVACTKPGGMTLEVTNPDSSMVMVGIRVLVGSQDVQRAPSTIEVFGRSQQVAVTRSRWYDVAFTREESLGADKKLSIFFGPSADPSYITMVDSVKVYCKTKEAFGWPEENEEFQGGVGPIVPPGGAIPMGVDPDGMPSTPLPLTPLDRLLNSCLEMLEGCVSVNAFSEQNALPVRTAALETATQLLTLPTPSVVHQNVKALLSALHLSRAAYSNHRDQALLTYVMESLNNVSEGKPFGDMDGESYYRLVAITRGIASARPSNLVQFAESQDPSLPAEGTETSGKEEILEERGLPHKVTIATNTGNPDESHLMSRLSEAFWHLHALRPKNPALAPVSRHGLVHVEATVQAVVEVIYAFTAVDLDSIGLAAQLYARLLLCEDTTVSFAAKQALIRVLRPKTRRRKVFIPSPPHCSTPGEAPQENQDQKPSIASTSASTTLTLGQQTPVAPPASAAGSSSSAVGVVQRQSSSESQQDVDAHFEVLEGVDPVMLLAHGASGGVGGAFPPLLDIPPDADDETMVELAIALSLQDHPGQAEDLNLQGLAMAAQGGPQRASSLEGGHYSDTTASAGASDDEGSTAATDGSTLRTSPAEQGGSAAGSESGGSGADSMTGEPNASGRSSAYGDNATEGPLGGPGGGARSETSSVGLPSASMLMLPPDGTDLDGDAASGLRLHTLRLALLERLLTFLPELRGVGGVRAVPFMQVVLMLSSDLDGEDERDRSALDELLSALIGELERDASHVVERTLRSEEQLIVMRLLSILMSRIKGCGGKGGEIPPSAHCSAATAAALHANGVVEHCLQLLRLLLDHWKGVQNGNADAEASGAQTSGPPLLKPHPVSPPPDMSPFFLRQYVKGHASDVFEAYPQLLTEMALRLPYQMKKVAAAVPAACPSPTFGQPWNSCLCEYMMVQQTPFIRRQVRKLLLFLCGSKEKYRQLRDFHALETHLAGAREVCNGVQNPSSLPYDSLVVVVEHLKACTEIATSRTGNWQRFCLQDETILPFLFQVSFLLDEGVASTILQLLQCALCGSAALSATATAQPSGKSHPPATSSPAKHRRERETSEEPNEPDEAQCSALAQQVNRSLNKTLLTQFIKAFLLESNSTSVRWQAHSLLYHLHRHSQPDCQEAVLDLLWQLWSQVPCHGRKASQFVDLLGYLTLRAPQPEKEFAELALSVLRQQDKVLAQHPNASLYSALRGLVELDGYFLESEPCLVCNNPEVPYANIKLSAIKVDSRFTTSTQIVKLVGSHTVSRIVLRIGDLKRSKMVRTINIYYNNRAVQSVVELKNRPALWHRAKRCSLSAGQTELKMEFPLPIVACNLMIEYADFYENVQASSETLQCPRCSASVPANPGVCSNCGENVFQCHKCRAINYDEKDPFLCNSCGFCKYAKFDYTLTAKPCCAVDPIEGEEDRKKAVAAINALLEKADKVYKQLVANKPALELLLLKVQEQGLVDKALEEEAAATGGATTATGASTTASSTVNRSIQQLAQKYCSDCKSSFDELSKIVQKVLASRKELVEYERKQRDARKQHQSQSGALGTKSEPGTSALGMASASKQSSGKCYGCASAAVEHCITLLRALATNAPYRRLLCGEGLIGELVEHNLRQGWAQVGHLLCLLTRDNPAATDDLHSLLMDRISLALLRSTGGAGASFLQQETLGTLPDGTHAIGGSPDLPAAVRHEVALMALSLQKEDSCWEQRLRYVMKLFLLGVSSHSPVVMECITLPCLKILQSVIKPEPPSTKRNKDKSVENLATVRSSGMSVSVDLQGWLEGDPRQSFTAWKQRCPRRPADTLSLGGGRRMRREDIRSRYLAEKYAQRWRQRTLFRQGPPLRLLPDPSWLRRVLFNPSCRQARMVACSLLEALCQVPSRCKEVLDMLTVYLDDLGAAGENGAKFLALYQSLIAPDHWKHYLAIRGLLPHLGELITTEIQQLTQLEETTLNADLSQGFALKMLTELLASFVEVDAIRQHYKSRLVGCVLNGYLSLRKLVVQRTKLIDETQDKLLELLEEMTTGTESETESFMAVCVETVKKYGLEDYRTPVFIFERLCSLIYPEENDTGEFFVTLEKDPQQEDFLQGRMLGNPYSSTEPGMGPLMRDIKNKICQDCELVALLEDDNGMELLVCNKIISLDLPVKDVYRKVWCVENSETEAMRVVYRMRGLLGDATEEFIESLDTKENQEVNEEEVYRLANVMGVCGGLQVMLQRLASVDDLTRGRPLLTVLLKLFGFCVKVKSNRVKLLDPSLEAVPTLLAALRLTLDTDDPSLAEQLLSTLEVVLAEGAACTPPAVPSGVTQGDITFLLAQVGSPLVKGSSRLLQLLMRVVPFLTLNDEDKMEVLIGHFKQQLNFGRFDLEHTADDDIQLECFCNLSAGIERNDNGNRLKELMVAQGIVQDAVQYLLIHAPPAKSSLLGTAENWKEFTSKPALKYVLRILTGLSRGHETTQILVSAECIPIIHRLEQVSSDEHVGSLAENLMEALKEHPDVAQKIEEVRKQTRDEKKRLAMAMRQKQLGQLGMRTNEKGQVTAKSSILKQMEDLGEEAGPICIICREGYKFQPNKVLGIYTFTKRCNVDDYEAKPRKTPGYSTVTHFNIVHVDCHMAAVRHARGRDEWESAALQNANTKCNGLLPLWGPQVPESAFASCLARHNTYIQDCTGHLDVGYASTLHDLKLLLGRFAQEKSFSEDSGGGGPQSNMHLIPYLLHMVLYVINTTRCVAREEKNLSNFLEMSPERQVENCFESEGPCYWTTMALAVWSPAKWVLRRTALLQRMIVLAQARHLCIQGSSISTLADIEMKDFSVYKPYLLFLSMVDGLYNIMFKRVSCISDESWPTALAEYIRHNDQPMLELGDKLLRHFEEQLLPCQSFAEYCDVMGLLSEIPDPDAFMQEALRKRACT
uniref:Putative e3 ubiquitin-protein ligase ubr4 n=1 Tax=Ornithodoros turicata TaxID=34597 RepID=A0A2R5LN58_9ACAR